MPSLKSAIGNHSIISLDDVCSLVSVTSTYDELDQPINTESDRQLFCTKLGITRAEFSSAGQLGHKPELLLLIDSEEYDDESHLKYDNAGNLTNKSKKYSIYKAFPRVDGFTELYCGVKIGD